MTFFRAILTLRTSTSQNAAHQEALFTINCQVVPRFARKFCTSLDLQIHSISLESDLNVVALSNIRTDGEPRRLTKRRKLNKNVWVLRARVNSRRIARVAAQVYKQT